MPLNYDSIGIDSILKKSHEIKFTYFIDGIDSDSILNNFLLIIFNVLTTDCVLQSCPAMVRSSLKESLLMTSTLQVSDLPKA